MNGSELSKVSHARDSGITINNDLKPSKHCSDIVKTTNTLVCFIGGTFESKSETNIITLFNVLPVRPHLDYCIQFRSPYYKKIIDNLERIQRKVTEMIPRLRNKPYEEGLKELNLISLSKRRLRCDQIDLIKIFCGFDNDIINDYVTTDLTSTTRNNGFKIKRSTFSLIEL